MMNEKFLVNHKFWRQVKKKKRWLSIGENKYINQKSTLNLFIYFYKYIFFNTKIIIG